MAGDEQIGLRIKLQERRAPLLDQVIGHDDHGLFRQPQAAHFHRGGRHGPGLARAHDVGQQRAAALQNAPDGVFLVRVEIVVAQQLARHAGKGQMRAVECAQAQIVEAVVVVAGKARGARPRPARPIRGIGP